MAKHLTYRDYVAAEAKGDKATMDAFNAQVLAEDASFNAAMDQDAENEKIALAALRKEWELYEKENPGEMTFDEYFAEAQDVDTGVPFGALDSRGRP